MHIMTLNELIVEIQQEENAEFYYEYLDFYGGNAHLRNPLNQEKEVYYFRGREKEHLLTGNEVIEGDYLILEDSSHDYMAGLYQYHSLLELKQHILRGGSYTNSFTASTYLIVNGKVKPFVVKGTDKNGHEVTHVKFENDDLFELELKEKWVEWLDEQTKEQELTQLEKEIQCYTPLKMVLNHEWDVEELAAFIQNLSEYDRERFEKTLDDQLAIQNEIADTFKQRLRKQPES